MKPIATTATLYFQNSAGRITEDAGGYLRLDWAAGPREEAAFRALLQHVIRALHRNRWGKLLARQDQMVPFTPAEQAWIVNEWMPRAVTEGGYRFGAVISAKSVFARLATNVVINEVRELPIVYNTFEDEGYAISWLRSQ
ncbi:hypothetical protein [Hymenobacter jejuensis]|uniref:STAS/SEC14 domain-containing protein n=1 Tax=Hymenobacter jejuensis TaxID=2502781 RepID=A0A5B8A575_9BACT|nr:hypothetical protein [Hymenobacter jejuensis]QDA61803.1 hypothetical protein FHG12_17630 [Hymenobacter jejuensis]